MVFNKLGSTSCDEENSQWLMLTKKYFLNAVKMQTVLTFWTCGYTNFVAICHDSRGMKKGVNIFILK